MTDLRTTTERVDVALSQMPIVAILRGLRTEEAISIVEALYEEGVRVAEVPLNSPNPFETIGLLTEHFGERMIVGAGTVLTVDDVENCRRVHADIAVSPNYSPEVVDAALAAGIVPMPGVATASEAFAAYERGATYLKLFPVSSLGSGTLKAWKEVMSPSAQLVAVGGVRPSNAAAWLAGGARALGIATEIYRPGDTAAEVGPKARAFVEAIGKPQPRVISSPASALGEGPLFDPRGERLHWVDVMERKLFSYDVAEDQTTEVSLTEPLTTLLAAGSEGFVATSENGLVELRADGNGARAQTAKLPDGHRFNDGCRSADGTFWCGAMSKGLLAGTGALYKMGFGEAPTLVADGLGVPNGMAETKERDGLLVVDTLVRTLLKFPFKGPGLGAPAVVSDFLDLPGKPDGMTVGPDGMIYVAMWGGGAVAVLEPDGAFSALLEVPSPHVSSVVLHPQDPTRLFVTTSLFRLGAGARRKTPLAGRVFELPL